MLSSAIGDKILQKTPYFGWPIFDRESEARGPKSLKIVLLILYKVHVLRFSKKAADSADTRIVRNDNWDK